MATTAVGFMRRAVGHYRRHGITVERLITNNGSPYRSTIHAIACRALDIRHLHTSDRPRVGWGARRFRGGDADVLANGRHDPVFWSRQVHGHLFGMMVAGVARSACAPVQGRTPFSR
jgi:hypothetical protein